MPDLSALLNGNFHCPQCQAIGQWRPLARPQRRQRSTVQRLACRACGMGVFAKLPRSANGANGAREQAHMEYRGLAELAAVFPRSDACATLVPLGCIDCMDGAIVLTRAFDGVDLARRMRASGPEDARKLLHAAGVLLRTLHDCSPRGASLQPLEVDERLDYLSESYGDALRDAAARRACGVLADRAEAVRTMTVRTTWTHGDFKPENVLVDGYCCAALDTHLAHTGAIVFDLAAFLDHLLLAGEAPGGGVIRGLGAEAEASFLAGYGGLSDGELRALRWAQLYFMLCYLGRARQRGVLSRAIWSRRMARLLGRLVAAA